MWHLDLSRLERSLEKAARSLNVKKSLVLLFGTLALAALVQGAQVKYSGSDAATKNLLSAPDLQIKFAMSCKVISESKGLLHEFDTLGDLELPGQGIYSPRSSRENVSGKGETMLSLVENNNVGMNTAFGAHEYQVQLQLLHAASSDKKISEGVLRVSSQGEGSVVIDLSSDEFLKCVAFRASPNNTASRGEEIQPSSEGVIEDKGESI